MAERSFPLIGVDRHGNKTPVEQTGVHEMQAATRLLDTHPKFVSVLSGDQRVHSGRGGYYGKHLKTRGGFEIDPESSALGQAIAESRAGVGQMIINQLRSRGLQLDVGLNDGHDQLFVSPAAQLTDEDRATIEEHKMAIIALIKADQPESPKDEPMGKRQDILRKVLPQMPLEFKRAELQQRLQECGYEAMARNQIAVENAISYGLSQGMLHRVSRGVYRVDESLRNGVIEEIKAEAPQPVIEAPKPILPPIQHTNGNGLMDALVFLGSEIAAGPIDDGKLLAIEQAFSAFETTMTQALLDLEGAIRPVLRQWRQIHSAHQKLREQFKSELAQ